MTAFIGHAFCFGDNIDTDVLAPGPYLKRSPEELAQHCLEAVDPEFVRKVRPGDFLLAGTGFGIGSSREQAAVSLRLLGIRAVLAHSFARIFWRNAINLGLPALRLTEPHNILPGDRLSVDLETGRVENLGRGGVWHVEPLPARVLGIVSAGGLLPYLTRELRARGTGHPS